MVKIIKMYCRRAFFIFSFVVLYLLGSFLCTIILVVWAPFEVMKWLSTHACTGFYSCFDDLVTFLDTTVKEIYYKR